MEANRQNGESIRTSGKDGSKLPLEISRKLRKSSGRHPMNFMDQPKFLKLTGLTTTEQMSSQTVLPNLLDPR
eukprot:11703493-Heterocapsa_arctica.AAC.1